MVNLRPLLLYRRSQEGLGRQPGAVSLPWQRPERVLVWMSLGPVLGLTDDLVWRDRPHPQPGHVGQKYTIRNYCTVRTSIVKLRCDAVARLYFFLFKVWFGTKVRYIFRTFIVLLLYNFQTWQTAVLILSVYLPRPPLTGCHALLEMTAGRKVITWNGRGWKVINNVDPLPCYEPTSLIWLISSIHTHKQSHSRSLPWYFIWTESRSYDR